MVYGTMTKKTPMKIPPPHNYLRKPLLSLRRNIFPIDIGTTPLRVRIQR
jgi:hypothetical protein